jgi:hypothetical protein
VVEIAFIVQTFVVEAASHGSAPSCPSQILLPIPQAARATPTVTNANTSAIANVLEIVFILLPPYL